MVRLGPARVFASKDVHEPGARTDAEFLEHVRTVMLDGPDGEVEDPADLLVRMAEREEICHLVLSSCETPPLMCSYLGVTIAAPRDARGGDPTLDRRADPGDAVDTQRSSEHLCPLPHRDETDVLTRGKGRCDVEATAIVLDPDEDSTVSVFHEHSHARSRAMATGVAERFLRDAIGAEHRSLGRLSGEAILEAIRDATVHAGRTGDQEAERRVEPLSVQDARMQLERQPPQAIDHPMHLIPQTRQGLLVSQLGTVQDRCVQPVQDDEEALHRIVMDPFGDATTFLLLRLDQALHELLALPGEDAKSLVTSSLRVFGFLPGRDIELDPLIPRDPFAVVPGEDGLDIVEPDDPAIARDHAVLELERLPRLQAPAGLVQDVLAILRMEALDPR